MNRMEFARLLGVDVRSVSRWESGDGKPKGSAEAILTGLREKLQKDPRTGDRVLAILGAAVAVGGLAYLIVRLLDALTEEGE